MAKIPSASERARRIILENLGKLEKKTLRELVGKAGIAVTNSSFDTYETSKIMQIAKQMGLSSNELNWTSKERPGTLEAKRSRRK